MPGMQRPSSRVIVSLAQIHLEMIQEGMLCPPMSGYKDPPMQEM